MIDIASLAPELNKRLRRINHLTSSATAIRIIESGCIWSRDVDGPANFSLNQIPRDHLDESPEISLQFEFTGSAVLVPWDFPATKYVRNILFIHVTEGLDSPTLDTIKVWAARWPAGSTEYMRCLDFARTKDFIEASRSDPYRQLLLARLMALLGSPKTMRVPVQSEIAKIKSQATNLRLSLMQLWRQRLFGHHPMPD